MTKAQIVDQLISSKENELVQAQQIKLEFDNARNDKFFEVIQKYFGGEFSLEDVSIKRSWGASYEVVRPREGYNYDKELLTIRFRDSWDTGEFHSIDTSVYSTSDNSEWELERLITCGEVAKVILDFKDDMLAEMNTVVSEFKDSLLEATKKVWEIEKDIDQLKADKSKFEVERKMNLLEGEGLNFEKPINLDVRWDWTVRGINKAKITGKTKSGKSVSLLLSTSHGDVEVENVRVDKLLYKLA